MERTASCWIAMLFPPSINPVWGSRVCGNLWKSVVSSCKRPVTMLIVEKVTVKPCAALTVVPSCGAVMIVETMDPTSGIRPWMVWEQTCC